MAEARGYNKGALSSFPTSRAPPALASPLSTLLSSLLSPLLSPRLASPRLVLLLRARSVPLRRVATVPSSDCHTLGIGKGRPWRRAQARGSNGKKSAGLTTGDGRRIDRANIGDRESAERVYGYNCGDAAHGDGLYPARPRANDAPPDPGGLDYLPFRRMLQRKIHSSLSRCALNRSYYYCRIDLTTAETRALLNSFGIDRMLWSTGIPNH